MGNEESRQLRVQLLLVEGERDELRDKVDLDDKRFEVLENRSLRTLYELEIALQKLDRANSDLQDYSRKNEALKVRCDTSIEARYEFVALTWRRRK